MLDIIIDGKKYSYVNSVKINDDCYIAYSDGVNTYISAFHYEGDIMVIEEIDNQTFLEVKEALA